MSELKPISKESLFARRDLLRGGAIGASLAALASRAEAFATPGLVDEADESHPFRVKHIERTTVKLPYREVVERNMARELPHWKYLEVCEVELESGKVGIGETMLFYTWGATGDDDVARAQGANALKLMWDDSLGAGLQMAIMDAVARTLSVPIHALLGPKARDKAPLSWWAIDMSPEDWLSECKDAQAQGYTAFKTKGRPWFDIREQVRLLASNLPANFKIDMDFNETLLDAERAIPILKELEVYPQVGIYESPIPQADIPGNQAIRKAVKTPIAMHYATPPAVEAIRYEVCAGFVIKGGVRELMAQDMVATMAGMPLWIQLVGSDITAAYSLQHGGVLQAATWPAVNCHQLYAEQLLTRPIKLNEGLAEVSDEPGLGYDLNRDVMRRYKVEKPPERPEPERLIEVRQTDGTVHYVASNRTVNFMITQGMKSNIPYYRPGVMTRLVPDDGSQRWKRLYEQAQDAPVVEKP